jgi:signal transduction histidine kinase
VVPGPVACDHRAVRDTGTASSAQRLPALPLERPREGAVVAGAAAALAHRLDVDPLFVRLGFVVLALAGGAGVVIYLLAWGLSPAVEEASTRATHAPTQRAVALGAIVLGLLLICRDLGLWFGDALVWPVTLGAIGSAVLWSRSGAEERDRFARLAARVPAGSLTALATSRGSLLRVSAGVVLVAGGMTAFVAANASLEAFGTLVVGMAVSVAGVGLVAGPMVMHLARQLADERRARIRSAERAEVAAHLHDSVLQTLALIQRSSDRAEMAHLARTQERELRSWLYGTSARQPDGLRTALEGAATRIEELYRVPVEVVVVGDRPLDEQLRALVQACAEAAGNAARHSGAGSVSVFAEVEPERVTVWVRDEGQGFDEASVPPDRRGIAESIRGRMARHGGTATITSEPGEGTEVCLEVTVQGGEHGPNGHRPS